MTTEPMRTPHLRRRARRADLPAPRDLRRAAPLAAVACAVVLAGACGGGSASDERAVTDAATFEAASAPKGYAVAGQAGEAVASSKVAAARPPAPSTDAAMAAAPDAASTTATQPTISMIIRTGQASVEVRDADSASTQLRALVERLGGYVANSSLQAGHDQVRTAVLEVKVPAERFEQALTGLQPLGTVELVNVDAQDVGEEFTDLTARIANSRRLEERLVQLLATRTGKLEDVLAVERELARVREEIERVEGRMRYLRARVALSTLTVTLHEPMPLAGTGPGDNAVVRAVRQAWRNFVDVVAWLIAAAGALLPLAVIAAVIWAVLRRLGVSLRRPRASRPPPPTPPSVEPGPPGL